MTHDESWVPSILRNLPTDPIAYRTRSSDSLSPLPAPPIASAPRQLRSRRSARGGGDEAKGQDGAGSAGVDVGAGVDARAGDGAGVRQQSDDAVEAGPEVVVGTDSTGAQVIRKTTFEVAADADVQGGVQRGRGSGNSSNKQLARARSADSRVHSYRRQPTSRLPVS